MKRLIVMLALAAAVPVVLQGCGPALVGGTVAGATMLHDRRDSAANLDDKTIVFDIQGKISGDNSLAEHSSVGVTSYNRTVLLTGRAETAALKARIHAIAQAEPKMKRLVDEITVGPRPGPAEESTDLYITSQVKLALFGIKLTDFDPTRIKVVTENKVVYLLGLVTPAEASAVVEKARYVAGVARVVRLFENYQPQPQS